MGDVLQRFSPATRAWFAGAFAGPTSAQEGAWDAIAAGGHTLVIAPTGSGKTLAAFLWAIDRLLAGGGDHVEARAAHGMAAPRGTRPSTLAPRHPAVSASPTSTSPTSTAASPPPRTRVLYISPLKALGVDVERNLRAPLVGIAQTAARLGSAAPAVTVGIRSGDTPPDRRRALVRTPPDILITTPESLFLMLTSAARESLRGVDTVIVDEVHAVAATKRGAHLALSLERLDALLARPAQRIGLSATVRPAEEVARFLGGRAPVRVVAPPSGKRLEVEVVVPVEDMSDLSAATQPAAETPGGGRPGSIWPHVEEAIVDRVLQHRSTIVFANSRRLAERLTSRMNEIYAGRMSADLPESASQPSGAGARVPAELIGGSGQTAGLVAGSPVLARAHHGSVSREQRALIEDELKSGRLRCVVATSSLELGIDMGEVDLVVQVEAPPSVASGVQRVGRAGHQVGGISRGVMFPKHRADLIHCAVASERMTAGLIEELSVPANPLDILAQHTVSAAALEPIAADAWFDTVRASAPFAALPRSAFDATLDLLAGRYPSDEFAELRPRIVWDRDAGVITGRPGAQRLAVTSGGTIPDRGLFGVFVAGEGAGRRVGELDEEMVYESRAGDVFALGSTSWRIQEITHDRVLVVPAFGEPGRLPFWKGDGVGRPAELGEAVGAFVREVGSAAEADALARCAAAGLDDLASRNLVAFLAEQKAATGRLPTDRMLVAERFHDELGDWRLVLHSPYGMAVHAPWALAVGARIRERYGTDGSCVASDDGVVARIPDTTGEPPDAQLFLFEPDELEALVTAEVGGSALFAARFRECAARALLLPRRHPGKRSPLWQQRQRSAQLLDVARQFPQFPIILETMRECLRDVYDLPALTELTHRIGQGRVRIAEVATESPSPFARTLLFGYIAAFLYAGDSPLAERRATALSVDATLLAELLGTADLRELLDPAVIDRVERELQRLEPERRVRGAEGVADLLRLLGPLGVDEIALRLAPAGQGDAANADGDAPAVRQFVRDAPEELAQGGRSGAASRSAASSRSTAASRSAAASQHATRAEAGAAADALVAAHRALRVTIAGREQYAAIEDAPRLRDGLGVPLPIGVPVSLLDPVRDPVGDLVGRYARTHGPFATADAAGRLGLGVAVVHDALRRLAHDGRVTAGEFLPADPGDQWCDAEVLRRLRRLCLAAARHEVEPVEPAVFARFLPVWQHVGGSLAGVDGVAAVIDQLAGVRLPASAWESLILPARVADYRPALLDELTSSGDVLWAGGGALTGGDGWISLHPADTAALTLPARPDPELDDLQRAVLVRLDHGGGYFFRQLSDALGLQDDAALSDALWGLAWGGLVTNDTLAPVRAALGGHGAHRQPRAVPRTRLARAGRHGYARPASVTRAGPPTVAGRWSALPPAEADPTLRARAAADTLLERYGVVTRGSAVSEAVPGGFALMYRVLRAFEDSGQTRRGYFIESLGAAQFAAPAIIDRLRGHALSPSDDRPLRAVTLAATDPANPYGAALPWPPGEVARHRPGRKAGALVVLVDGMLTLYLERGGKSALAFSDDVGELSAAARSVADTVRRGRIGKLSVETVGGEPVGATELGRALSDAGFTATPRGLRLRA